MGFGPDISEKLTTLLAATAICGGSMAIAPGSEPLAVVELLLGVVGIGHSAWQKRAGRMDVVLRRCTREIEAAADGWLTGEFRSRSDAVALRDQAIEAIRDVLPLIVPSPEELVAARITERNVAAFYTARAAAERPGSFADTEQNAIARYLFGLMIGKAYGIVVRQPEFAADMLRHTLAELLEGQDAQTVAVALVGKRTERIEQSLDDLPDKLMARIEEYFALARSSGATQRAAEQGIPEAAVRAIVLRLGGEGIARDDLIPWLDNWIAAASEELGKRSNEGEAFEAARKEAERRFRAGRIKDASAAFMDELAREERQEAERQAERKHRRVRLLEEAIRFDELAFDAQAAVEKLRLMAAIEGADSADALAAWLFGKADEFYERGHDKGANAALAVAITAYRAALEERTRERVPLDWAMTQNNLGIALQALGERESGTARLEEAVAAYRAALEERTRERVPLDWAATQNNLGTALQALGGRESGTSRLDEAVAAYRAALKEMTRECVPLDWAMTQNNLGNALATLGGRESGTARLEEAVAAWDQCLTVLATTWPPEWIQPVRANRETALAEIARRANPPA